MTRAIATAAQGPQGPSFRIRLMLPAAALSRHGVTLLPMPLLSAAQAATVRTGPSASRARAVISARSRLRRELRDVDDADVVVVQRQVDPLPGRRLDRAAIGDRPLVLDIDDAVWLPEPGGHPLARLRRNEAKLRWLASRAERVIAGNEHLADWLSGHARDVSVVPSLVDTEGVARRVHAESDTVVVGWIGSASTALYLRTVAAPLAAFAACRPRLRLRLVVVGGVAPEIPGVAVEQWPWSERNEADALRRLDIGLMPLPDTAWTRGKCAYKALQYMAAAIPVVADDVGLTSAVVGDGVAGVLARHPVEWEQAIGLLADSAAMRQRMGDAGRARVQAGYSVSTWSATLAKLIGGG
jgi:glycosyltransferase involved in cell wall biosynthesis